MSTIGIEYNIWNEKQNRLSSSIHKSKGLWDCVKKTVARLVGRSERSIAGQSGR